MPTIEKNLDRVADALERIAGALEKTGAVTQSVPGPTEAKAEQAPPPPPAEPKADTPPPPPAAEPKTEAAAPPPPGPVSTLTPQELNEALVEEFKRLGSRDPIDRVMREMFKAQSINQVPEAKYQELLDAVRAVPAGS